jgi:hypothetical protein
LEQAVVALETAAQEQDTLLVSGDYFRRKSSWSSIEEVEGNSNSVTNADAYLHCFFSIFQNESLNAFRSH